MKERIYLGRHRVDGPTYLEKHAWDCGWYWGFGYIGNDHCHWHIEALIKHPGTYEPKWTNIDFHFDSTWITQEQWWILRDLFISAYALQKAAEVYRLGGHQTGKAAPYRVTDAYMAERLNADLGRLLDTIWNLLQEWKGATLLTPAS